MPPKVASKVFGLQGPTALTNLNHLPSRNSRTFWGGTIMMPNFISPSQKGTGYFGIKPKLPNLIFSWFLAKNGAWNKFKCWNLFLKIPLEGKFRLGTRNIFSSFWDGKILSLSADMDSYLLPFYFSRDISVERAYDQNDFHIIDLYSYLGLENLIISMSIFKKTKKVYPPSLHPP